MQKMLVGVFASAAVALVLGCGGGESKMETPKNPAPMPKQGPSAVAPAAPASPPAKDVKK